MAVITLTPEQADVFVETLTTRQALPLAGTKVEVNENGVVTPLVVGTITASKQETIDGDKTRSTVTVDSQNYSPSVFAALVEIPKRKYDANSEFLTEWIIKRAAEQIAIEMDSGAADLLNTATTTVEYDADKPVSMLRDAIRAGQTAGFKTDTFLFDSLQEVDFYAEDTTGRPLFQNSWTEDTDIVDRPAVARLLGRKVVFATGVANGDTVGYFGQLRNNLIWGVVDDKIDVVISLEGSVDNRSALQKNLVFIRVEVLAVVGLQDESKVGKIVDAVVPTP